MPEPVVINSASNSKNSAINWSLDCGGCGSKKQDLPNVGNYLARKAPKQVEPGISTLEGVYVNDIGRIEPWKAYYDKFGRLIGRTDFNAENLAAGIPSIHYHAYEYNAQYPYGHSIGNHMPGEYHR